MAIPNNIALHIPKCMSTQHPDNVNLPFFAENSELGGEDEIQEAYYAYSHLGCDEQMWDCEGKEVDNFVVKKLFTKYENYFQHHRLGDRIFLTLRVPNPTIEKTEAKILLETLESIPRSYDAAKLFYSHAAGNGSSTAAATTTTIPAPIFEVILPMTTSAKCLNRIYHYYQSHVIGKQSQPCLAGDITIAEWIGEFAPSTINIIPLFEDQERLLHCHEIVRDYVRGKQLAHQRVFLARSDPAVNYGLISAVLLNKIALQNLHQTAQELEIAIYPIVGVGSAPFRGNLRPPTVRRVIAEYAGAHTFTIQSSFKYDYQPNEVAAAIKFLRDAPTTPPQPIDQAKCLEIINRYSRAYIEQIKPLAPLINLVAKYVPRRRKRKLHIGLFGYSRSLEQIALPRAITFTAALYSLGLPPEIFGLHALTPNDFNYLRQVYPSLPQDLADALTYFNPNSPFLPPELRAAIAQLNLPVTRPHAGHQALTIEIAQFVQTKQTDHLTDLIQRAALYRGFLG